MFKLLCFTYFTSGIMTFSGFFQHEYTVIHERMVPLEVNTTIMDNISAEKFISNRTYRSMTGQVRVKVDIHSAFVNIRTYKYLSNEYRYAAIDFNIDLCKSVNSHKDLLKCTNATGCPLKKGFYIAKECTVDDSRLPPHIPTGRYKLDMKNYFNGVFAMHYQWYGEIKEIIHWE